MMCGRFVNTIGAAMERYFDVHAHQLRLSDHYTVAPTTEIAVIRVVDRKRTLSRMHWGLIPFWAKDIKIDHETINAGAETGCHQASI
jgi:putative SOS response-associated peptidase YedK